MSKIRSLSYAQQVCVKTAGKAMQKTGMLRPGARVGVAVSGGVDSFVLLKVMQLRQRIVPFPFEFMALHLNPGFEPASHAPLVRWLAREGIAGHVEVTDYGPRGHSEENLRHSPCFYCARLRRKRLFALCAEYRLTHLAFGHNNDDLVTTFLMNLVQTGKVAGMSMSEPFFGGALQVIRPLLLLPKAEIVRAARQWELPVFANACPSAGSTRRTGMLDVLDAMCGGSKVRRKNVFNGLARWQLELNEKARIDWTGEDGVD
ncbi:tRNA 2-thiocytidine biosynthesis TtcA family protein [uncultured Mailhella sp.]|uniref:tRNA lysidine(34) synthetase n=1 Tax=uncultured Mailhella sp. TaxID=1981031 RepID=UPI00261911DA|nr:tRNA 2-thiocytidine biosynthesis TtcA family protein [uncultured Mailhella sp.]